MKELQVTKNVRSYEKLRKRYEVTKKERSYEKGTKKATKDLGSEVSKLRDSNATYQNNLLWRSHANTVLLLRKKRKEKAGHAQSIIPDRAFSGDVTSGSHVTNVTSG